MCVYIYVYERLGWTEINRERGEEREIKGARNRERERERERYADTTLDQLGLASIHHLRNHFQATYDNSIIIVDPLSSGSPRHIHRSHSPPYTVCATATTIVIILIITRR